MLLTTCLPGAPSTRRVEYAVRDGVAEVALNPRVNALGLNVCRSLIEAIDRANDSDDVRAIVLMGTGATFAAAADIHARAS